MKSKLINFEYFPAIESDTYNRITHDIALAASSGYTSVIGLLLADGFYINITTYGIHCIIKLCHTLIV